MRLISFHCLCGAGLKCSFQSVFGAMPDYRSVVGIAFVPCFDGSNDLQPSGQCHHPAIFVTLPLSPVTRQR